MRNHLFVFITTFFASFLSAQVPYNSVVPNGYSKRAKVSEQIGLTEVSITYHRPAVKGREGKIWGGVIHKGFVDPGFGDREPAPWRAGANETTLIEFDHDVQVQGQPLQKGKYGLFIAYDSLESIVIFSKQFNSWGSFFYHEKDDVLRIKVKPLPLEQHVEYLKYEFTNQTTNSSVITLAWEKRSIPIKVEVDYLKQQFDAFVSESQNPSGFTSQGLNIAANWCLQNNYQLEKALQWATLATAPSFPGDPTSFPALVTKYRLYQKLGKTEAATALLQTALPHGNMVQLQQLGRQLITGNQPKVALDIFRYNYTKHPEQFITLTGMALGLSANREYEKALEYANKALSLAPNDANKQAVATMIEKLKAGKDIH